MALSGIYGQVHQDGGGQNEQDFHWNRASSSSYHPMEFKAHDEMPEDYRIVEELIDLLEDEKSTDEQIRKKIDALHQAREKAREALPEAKKELSAVLTTQRQEAIFLIMGDID
jgi:predicted HAD superfamily Cof-like phosphohydrolase